MTRSQSASASSALHGSTRASAAETSPALSLPLSASRAKVFARYARAASRACGFVSKSLTVSPASAVICAMPRPIAPAPTMATVSTGSGDVVVCMFILPKTWETCRCGRQIRSGAIKVRGRASRRDRGMALQDRQSSVTTYLPDDRPDASFVSASPARASGSLAAILGLIVPCSYSRKIACWTARTFSGCRSR